jgi:hypothetical protein
LVLIERPLLIWSVRRIRIVVAKSSIPLLYLMRLVMIAIVIPEATPMSIFDEVASTNSHDVPEISSDNELA